MKKVLKVVLIILLIVVILAGGYISYVFIDYHRIGSGLLATEGTTGKKISIGQQYNLMSWNIGFGAYTADYDFFMDGGTQSWAESPERLDQNLADISKRLKKENADLYLIQEVDTNATRSYHRDERIPIIDALGADYCHVFCQNYDSPFLMYPFTQPHGASEAGLLTFSRFDIGRAERMELPIEDTVMKLLDLDRCYSVSCIPTSGKRPLYLFNLHLSAYTSDGSIATEQLQLLLHDMQFCYNAGCYCIAGGDFNKDVLGNSAQYFGAGDKEYTWAQPIPDGMFDGFNIRLVAPLDESNPVPSCRNPDSAYHEGQYVLTVDGFLVSDNVKVEDCNVLDYGFSYSDHNPVHMKFTLVDENKYVSYYTARPSPC